MTGLSGFFGNFIKMLYEGIGNYALTIVVFTLIFKTVTSPLDFWQKHLMRKNKKVMKVMEPKLAKMREEVGNNQSLYMQRQQAIYKEHGYSMLGACLPMIVTLVIFGTIFSGFSAMVRYQNETVYETLSGIYYEEYNPIKRDLQNDFIITKVDGTWNVDSTDAQRQAKIDDFANISNANGVEVRELNGRIDAAARPGAEEAVKKAYEESKDSFIWVENIFMPDAPWSKVVPNYGLFVGESGGFLGIGKISAKVPNLNEEEYNKVMGAIIDEYGSKPNGFLIMPIICLLLNILMMKLNPQQQPTMNAGGVMGMQDPRGGDPQASAKQAQMSSKMTMYMMPAMMFIFALFYSGAFTLYLVVSTTFSIIFNFIYNRVTGKKDKLEEVIAANTTYVRKSELEAMRKKKEQEEKEKAEREQEEKAKKILEKSDSKFKDIDKL